ncbi:MAG: phenylalanine--tRNA ligase subunit beta [Rhodoluna sp.]|nr:phenylalanine--tRNA ligase subunit beta [Rhodoluna sp.]
MRVPLSWLAEYVDLAGDATPDSVMAELVKVGLEEEGSHKFSVTGPVVVGQVLEFTPEEQTNGKTIRWCQVRVAPEGSAAADGGADVRGIVCGASNFGVGDKVVVCLPGATLPGDFHIAARSTYGHISDGMMASARELELSDDHAGIIRLNQMGLDPKVGSDAIELLHLDDSAAEVNVTPDRGYCFSIRGVAREYAHATGADFRDPKGNAVLNHGEGFSLTLDDQSPIRNRSGMQRMVLRSVMNIDASLPTPPFMISRLKLAGMRSISLAVDITNYVMLELGQPTHAYDLDKLKGGITVRRAKPGETLKTLDGQIRKLDVEDLLICDDSGPIGLAGVMGGESTEVDSSTRNVLIESANFDPISIARSARRHKLTSEASKRFERGVDPMMADNAAARVVQLLEVHAKGEGNILGAEYKQLAQVEPIFLPTGYAESVVGIDFGAEEEARILGEIGCVVAVVDGGLEVIRPSWRSDITHKTDLVEEIARIGGYDRIPARLPVAPPGRGLTLNQKRRRQAISALVGAGHTEVLTYPFLSSAQNSWFAADQNAPSVRLANAMQEDAAEMRKSILPGLVDAAKRNLSRGLIDLAIFEEGIVFTPSSKLSAGSELPIGNARPSAEKLATLNGEIPQQPKHLAVLLTGSRVPHQVGQKEQAANYQDAINAVLVVANAVATELTIRQAQRAGFHPGRCAEFVSTDGVVVAVAGELDPALAIENDLPRRVAAAEINMSALYAAAPASISAQPIGIMPAATQDLSLVVAREVSALELQNAIVEGAGELLEHISLTDDYRGENVEESKKSLTFALRFRAHDRTLTQVEASQARDAGVANAAEKFGAVIRA